MATRTDKNGTVWEVDAQGNPLRPVMASRAGADPYKVNEEARKQQAAELAAQAAVRANINSATANANTQELTNLAKQKFAAELKAKGLMVGPDGQIIKDPNGATTAKPAMTGAQYADALAQFNGALYLRDSVTKLKDLNKAGPGSTSGVYGIQDYFPTTANSNFNKEADRLRAWAKQGTGTTGGENNSLAEMKLNLGAYIPNSWEYDSTNQGTFESLQALAEKSYNEAIQRLGGIPDAGGRINPIDPTVGAPPLFATKPDDKRNDSPAGAAPDSGGNGGGMGGGPKMPSLVGGVPAGSNIQFNFAKPEGGFDRNAWLQSNFGITPNQEAGITAFLKANRGNPNFGYNDIAAFYKGIGAPVPQNDPNLINSIRAGNVNVSGYDSTQAEKAYQDALAQRVKERDTTGGAIDTVGRMGANALFGAGDRFSAGIDTLTGGGSYSENLARQRFESDAAREANPLAAFGGDVAGLTLGTIGTGRLAQGMATRFMPNLARQGAVGSSFGRNLANDTAYGAAYGASEQGDPITGAITSGVGSAGGQLLGKTFGSVIGGVSDPVVQRLADRNIPMTVGSMLGNRGIIGRTVNKFESLPVVGDNLYNRRMSGNDAVFKGVLDDAVAPAGATIRGNGVEGLAEAQVARNQAYGDAYGGLNAPVDMQYLQEVAPAIRTGRNLPGDFGRDFSYAVESDLRPLFGNNRTLTGDTAQQMRQDLAEYAGDFTKKGKIGSKGAEQFRAMGSATDNLIERTNPGALPKIKAANQVNANLTPIENAMNTANGRIPTPLQLRSAITSNTKTYGGRSAAARGDKVPQLLDDAVAVLPPTIPNSGTADRFSSMLFPAALGGSAVGVGSLTEPEYAGPLALLTLLSTKSGQKALQATMTARTQGMRRAGGMFGSGKAKRLAAASGVATAPMLLPQ